jgi:hypothetical protein
MGTRLGRKRLSKASGGEPTLPRAEMLKRVNVQCEGRSVEAEIEAPDGRRPRVRTVWQLDKGQIAPRLITAYPLDAL